MLKKHFYAGNGSRMYELEVVLGNCKHQGDLVVEYFEKLIKMWDELTNYDKVPDCYYSSLT